MMHAENGMAIDVVAADLVAEGKTDPVLPRRRPLPDLRGRGDEPRDPPRRGRRRAGLHRPPLGARRARRGPPGARPGLDDVRRDLPPVPVPQPRRPRQRVRRREVRLLAAAPPEGPLGRALDGTRQGRPPGRLDRPLPVRLRRPEGARARATSGRSRTACRASRTGSTCSTTAASSAAGSRKERWVEIISTAPAKLFGMYPQKGAIASARTPTSSSTTRTRPRTISAKTHHMDVDYSCYEGRSVQGRSDVVLSRGSVIVRDGEFTGPQGRRQVREARARRLRPARVGPSGATAMVPTARTLRVDANVGTLADVRSFVRAAPRTPARPPSASRTSSRPSTRRPPT